MTSPVGYLALNVCPMSNIRRKTALLTFHAYSSFIRPPRKQQDLSDHAQESEATKDSTYLTSSRCVTPRLMPSMINRMR